MIFASESVGWAITAIAVSGVVLNNRRNRLCFIVWMASNALSAGVHLSAGMFALAARDTAFFFLAIHGLIVWSKAPMGKKTE